jgi:hydroxypyruvate reductase/glycerate 2-kinase
MDALEQQMRAEARAIWDAAVAAAEPTALVRAAITGGLRAELSDAPRILVVGGGKAAAAMAAGLEEALADVLDRVEGIVNVPVGCERSLRKIITHVARSAGSNFPTAEGIAGTERMLQLLAGAGPDDLAICLLSGGGSALLPAPAEGITLDDKLAVTQLLHASGATIKEMNAVRKHLSRSKGGGFARAFRGKKLFSLIISDVVGDPLDVIASGPTAADTSSFSDALAVLSHYDLLAKAPAAVCRRLEKGVVAGMLDETLKKLPTSVENRIIGSNAISLHAAQLKAEALGYCVLNLGSFIEGETREVATVIAGVVSGVRRDGAPIAAPACLLSGGETTVRLGLNTGLGGRNQEFVLALLCKLQPTRMAQVVALSGGTDGEDGPTDAAGATIGLSTWGTLIREQIDPEPFLNLHDAYSLFAKTGDLLKTGLTGTNVMDVRVVLVR